MRYIERVGDLFRVVLFVHRSFIGWNDSEKTALAFVREVSGRFGPR